MTVNGIRVGGPGIFGLMIWFLFLRFIVPILGIFYGTSLIADEVEDKTITYLFTRPISRSAVLVGKYLAYLASTVLIVLPSVMLVYFLVVPDWRRQHRRRRSRTCCGISACWRSGSRSTAAFSPPWAPGQAAGPGWPFLRLWLGALRPGCSRAT